jgi:DNA/RNA-binding domain of Phe-tRNA-synthetase-like protein
MGLYDMKAVSGNIMVDAGREGEAYAGISKELIHAEGKLILRDDLGVFGNPTADSKRTALSLQTTQVMAVFFTPPEVPRAHLDDTLQHLADLYSRECPDCCLSTACYSC